MNFEDLKVKSEIVKALKEEKITEPTLIQQRAIPLVKAGHDVIGMSKTGSGKTAAFGVPLLESIKPENGLQAIVLAPTRELAVQIAGELRKFGKYVRCSMVTVYGGVAIEPQIQKIARSHIVVGTPGRILDHLERRTMDLSKIRCCVLDEADKMVDMGFFDDVARILSHMPKSRQILLFGATLSNEIDQIRERYMQSPHDVFAEKHVKEDILEQFYYNVQPNENFSLLVHLLNKEDTKRVIIFCSKRSTVEIVTKNLKKHSIDAEMIHGKLSQNRRMRVMENFNKGKPHVLVASAVAARGLDIKDVTHIFNYDLSRDPQEYVHRVGRTARAGESGKAITLLTPKDYDAFNDIISTYRITVKELPPEEFQRLHFDARSQDRPFRGGGRFGRPSRPSYGDRRSPSRGRSNGNRRSFGNRESYGQSSRGERRPFNREGQGQSRYGSQSPRGERRSFNRGGHSSQSQGERRPFNREGQGQSRYGSQSPRGGQRSFEGGSRHRNSKPRFNRGSRSKSRY